MPNYNKVILIGHLARDPEMKSSAKGTSICKFTIAVSREWKTESGEKKEEVAFVECDAFARTAEVVAQYCRKGKALLVEGRLKQDNWEDKQTGQKRSKLGVTVESVQMLGSKSEGDGDSETKRRSVVNPEDLPPRPEKPGIAPHGPTCETEEKADGCPF